jgi:integrase
MQRHRLTDRFVRNISPKGNGRDEYLDALVPQLLLRVSPSGHRSFALLARYPGYKNPTRRLLGTYYDGDPAVLAEDDPDILDRTNGRLGAALSLAEAREKARYWLGLIARGRDPGAEKKAAVVAKKQQEADRQAAAATAFDKVAAQWLKRKAANLKHARKIERIIARDFTARWQGRPIASITRDEARAAIRIIAERGGWQAHSALGHLRQLLAWASECGEFGEFTSPLQGVKPGAWIDFKMQPRERILNDDEIRHVWHAAAQMEYPWGPCIRLLMLTGQRLREIASLSWPEIDLDGKLITIPAERMKGKAAHEVPLAPQALALLHSLPRFAGPFVFSLKGGVRPVGGFDRPKLRLDEASGVSGWRLHDLRRTARSNFSRFPGFEDVHREAVLDHRRKGIARTYDRHKYYAEKLALLNAWEERLRTVVADATPPMAPGEYWAASKAAAAA